MALEDIRADFCGYLTNAAAEIARAGPTHEAIYAAVDVLLQTRMRKHEIAAVLGVHHSTVSRWSLGHCLPILPKHLNVWHPILLATLDDRIAHEQKRIVRFINKNRETTMTKKQRAAQEKRIVAAYTRTCSGVQISILDINKVFKAGDNALRMSDSEADLEKAIVAFVATIRKN